MDAEFVIIDGVTWEIQFSGFDRALSARSCTDDHELRTTLRPWTYAQHFAALQRHLYMGASGLELDTDGYADAVLAQTGDFDDRGLAARRDLALWWAAGISPRESLDHPSTPLGDNGWVVIGDRLRARLRRWTWAEELATQRRCTHESGDPSIQDFEPVSYLRAMVEDCVLQLHCFDLDTPPQLNDLDARATRLLLAAVLEINHPDPSSDPLAGLEPAVMSSVLQVCRTLGCTPEQAMALPATEARRLLRMLQSIETLRAQNTDPRRTPRRRRPSVADHPDAIVLHFGGES